MLKGLNSGDYAFNTSLTVIIPTYNEELKIERCIRSVLASEQPCKRWKVVLVDDCSTDQTIQVVENVSADIDMKVNLVEIISAGERPIGEKWAGKNWACTQGMKNVDSSWVLFLDADVELEKDTLKRSIAQATEEKIDLLSLAPKLVCGCLSEWMVQPIIAMLLAIGFPISKTNSPTTKEAFAAGPYMLFKKDAYVAIGGHKNIPNEVVEDIKLASLIKTNGFKLKFILGLDSIKLRMYTNFSELWEGWTKNWFLGLSKNVPKSICASVVVFTLFTMPWIYLIGCTLMIIIKDNRLILINQYLVFAVASVVTQFIIRYWCKYKFNLPTKYWYLMSAGGVIIFMIGFSSIWKTLTGRGWTWKGRELG